MKHLSKRISALLLAALISVAALASCASEDTGTPDSGTDAATSADAATTEAPAETSTYDLLDIEKTDFDGYEFNFLAWSISGYTIYQDLYCETADGDTIGDAVYKRNRRVEEDFGINIKAEYQAHDQLNKTYTQFVTAGDEDYDAVFPLPAAVSTVLNANILYDMYQLPYINWDEPWWDQDSIEELSLGGKLHMVNSDITIMDNSGVACILFNKKLAEKYSIDNLYKSVLDNKWTMEKMTELCKGIKEDLDGNGEYDADDLWGLLGSHDSTYYLLHAGGGRYADKDSDDLPEIAFGDERTINLAQYVVTITQADYFFNHHIFNGMDAMKEKMFSNDQGLFTTARMINVENLRNMDTDYGVLPMPKYEESQEKYLHSVSVHKSTIMTLPKTLTNPERTATILQAMAAASTDTVKLAYYEHVLKGKYSRDSESMEMLDIIFGSRVYDLGEFYSFGKLNNSFLYINNKPSQDVASMFESHKKAMEKDIERLIKNLQKEEA